MILIEVIFILLLYLIIKWAFRLLYPEVIKKQPDTTIPMYELFYADEKVDNEKVISSKILKSEKYKLKGKPDYIVKHIIFNKYIPIELKSGNINDKSFPNEYDLMQLVTYFLIIEDLYNYRPKKGLLVYNDYMFEIKNTRKLRKKALVTIRKMNKMMKNGRGKAEPSNKKCRLCRYRGTGCKFYK